MPVRYGGLSLREAVATSGAAFIASCNSIRVLSQDFLRQASESAMAPDSSMSTPCTSFSGESVAYIHLLNSVGNSQLPFDVLSATQRQLQSHVNSKLFNSLQENASIREKARLNTISSEHAGAWLRAIPNPHLGLTMSPHEFIIAVRIWLGIPLFPSPPDSLKCCCGQTLDPFGNHLLSCCHGPLCVRRHNALCEIIFHALLSDCKNVKLEQRCSGEDGRRPGDVYHPDFLEDKAGYFDISIRNSLQPSYVTKSAIQAGAAAEAGELEKDSRHEASVIAVGGLFYPMVVETLGLWTPFGVKTRKAISSKASAISCIPFTRAFKNLLEQLSVKLWQFNAKMVYARMQLEVEDVFSWDLPVYGRCV